MIIASMGTGRKEDITLGLLELISRGNCLLQTAHTPAGEYLAAEGYTFETLDADYDAAEDFDDLISRAGKKAKDAEAFIVLGSPAGNKLAEALIKEGAEVRPGVSAAELAAAAAGITGEFIAVSASEFTRFNASKALIVTEIDNPYTAADVALIIKDICIPEAEAYVVRGGKAEKITVGELDRQEGFSYDTAFVIPAQPYDKRERYDMDAYTKVIARLRAPGGCPWDAEQTYETLRQTVLEEAWEVIDAVDKQDPFMLADELGDLLLQVVMYSAIGSELGEFDIDEVTTLSAKKMIHRHPHVFGTVKADTSDEVLKNWEVIKRGEKSQKSIAESMEDIPKSMSMLARAAKIQKKAALVGFDWDSWHGPMDKVREEIAELEEALEKGEDIELEAGDLLFAAANLMRHIKVSPDVAIGRTCDKFISRYKYMEESAKSMGKTLYDLTLDEQEELWQAAKKEKSN